MNYKTRAAVVGADVAGRTQVLAVREVLDAEPPTAFVRIGETEVVIDDPKALLDLAGAFAELADDAVIAAEAARKVSAA